MSHLHIRDTCARLFGRFTFEFHVRKQSRETLVVVFRLFFSEEKGRVGTISYFNTFPPIREVV